MKQYKKILIFVLCSILLLIGSVSIFKFERNRNNIKEEIFLGDINDKIDYTFTVSWKDENNENNRPESVTYNLYNVLNQGIVVSTVTLTNENADPNDSNKWNGVFQEVPKYNQDTTLAEYIIKQENLNNYHQNYSRTDYNGLCMSFGDSGNGLVNFITEHDDGNYYYLNNSNNAYTYSFPSSDLANKKVCVPVIKGKEQIYITGDHVLLNAKGIYPTYQDSYDVTQTAEIGDGWEEFYGRSMPNVYSSANALGLKYTWAPNRELFPNVNLIENISNYSSYDFEVKWINNGFADKKPNSVTYELYKAFNNELVSSTTITKSSQQGDTWHGSFSNILRYDNNGDEIEYLIKQKANMGYYQTFDRKNKNGLCVTFGNQDNYNSSSYVYITTDHINNKFYAMKNPRYNGFGFQKQDMQNQTVCFPTIKGKERMYFISSYENLDIKNIYPTFKDKYDTPYSVDTGTVFVDYKGEEYPNISNRINGQPRYTFEPNTNTFINADLIINEQLVTNVKFDKYWEDEGFENLRPTSSEFYLYDKNDQTTKLAKITLDQDDYDPNDSNHMIGEFKNVLAVRPDGTKREFVVREKEIPKYTEFYDSSTGIRIKFNENADAAREYALMLFFHDDHEIQYNGWYAIDLYPNFLTPSFGSKSDIANKTFDISNPSNVGIRSVSYSSVMSSIEKQTKYSDLKLVEELVGNNYPESKHPFPYGESHAWHYKYTYSSYSNDFYLTFDTPSWGLKYGILIDSITTIGNEDIVTSIIDDKEIELEKRWDDEGHENERPNEVIIDIYDDENKTNLVKTVSLNEDDASSPNVWKQKVEHLKRFDDNGEEKKYYIKERAIDKYQTYYDYNDYYNGLAVTFSEDSNVGTKLIPLILGETRYNGSIWESNKQYSYDNIGSILGNPLAGSTILVPSKEISLVIYCNNNHCENNENKVKVVDIKPIHFDSNNFNTYFRSSSFSTDYEHLGVHLNNDYLNSEELNLENKVYAWSYKWIGDTESRENETVVINKYNEASFPFSKEWNDQGFENERPEKVKFNLYNIKDETKIVSTLELTKSNENHNNSHEWKGTFNNIPKFNNNGTVAEYIVKEEENDKYDIKYNITKTGYCVKTTKYFNNNVAVTFRIKNGDDYYYITNKDNLNNVVYFSKYNLSNGEFCFEADSNDLYIEYNNRNNGKQVTWNGDSGYAYYNYPLIESIYPVNLKEYNYVVGTVKDTQVHNYVEVMDNEPFDTYERHYRLPDRMSFYYQTYIHYKWVSKDEPFAGANIIINTANMRKEQYIKIFDDEGFENLRPKELKFALYEINGIMPREIKTINTRNCNENVCEIDFGGVMDKDIDGNPINYRIVELETYGYDVSYEDNKVINKAVPIDVNIINFDDENNKLSGVKLGIYKDGNEVLTYVTSDEIYEVKLLPGEYEVKELEVPKGYKISFDINIKVNEDGTIEQDDSTVDDITIINEKIKGFDIKIKKTMKDSNNEKFKFRITIENFNDSINYIGDKTGTLEFESGVANIELGANEYIILKDIPIDSKYEVIELEEDYDLTIKGTNEGILKQNTEIEFVNEKKVVPIVEPTPSTIDEEVIDAVNGDDKETLTGDEETDVKTPITGITSYIKYIGFGILLTALAVMILLKKKTYNKG